MNYQQREVFAIFTRFKESFVSNKHQIDHFVDYNLKFQSGFMCNLCDLNYNHYFYERNAIRKVLNWSQCRELNMNYYLFMPVIFDVYRVALTVNSIQCSLWNDKDRTIQLNFDKVIDEYKKLTHCIYFQDDPKYNNEFVECLKFCKRLSKFNWIDDSIGLFDLVNKLYKFYYDFLHNSFFSYNLNNKFTKQRSVDLIHRVFRQEFKYLYFNLDSEFNRSKEVHFFVDKIIGVFPFKHHMKFRHILSINNILLGLFSAIVLIFY